MAAHSGAVADSRTSIGYAGYMRVLAADVGGTKANVAVYEWRDERLHCVHRRRFVSSSYDSLEAILVNFGETFGETASIAAAAFGVAGPVLDGHARVVNLGWRIEEQQLCQTLRIDRVAVINDLEATAYGIPLLQPEDIEPLNEGERRRATVAVIAAGTGLGEGLLWWDGARYHPAPSEGGHADFAPRDEREMALLRYLQRRFEHVSYERLLSGAGLVHIYEFLRDHGDAPESAAQAERLAAATDRAASISEAGLDGTDPLCAQALDLFVSIYGAEAGNLALKVLPWGGVYVAGGIAPKIASKMRGGRFRDAFLDKGRMRPLLDRICVDLVQADDAPLRGAAGCALRLTGVS